MKVVPRILCRFVRGNNLLFVHFFVLSPIYLVNIHPLLSLFGRDVKFSLFEPVKSIPSNSTLQEIDSSLEILSTFLERSRVSAAGSFFLQFCLH